MLTADGYLSCINQRTDRVCVPILTSVCNVIITQGLSFSILLYCPQSSWASCTRQSELKPCEFWRWILMRVTEMEQSCSPSSSECWRGLTVSVSKLSEYPRKSTEEQEGQTCASVCVCVFNVRHSQHKTARSKLRRKPAHFWGVQ